MAKGKEAAKGGAAKAQGPAGRRGLYEVKGNQLIRKKKACPKCGPGVFLAEHKDRDSYVTGFYEQRVDELFATNFWAMLRDGVFVVASLAWIFSRYIRAQASQFADPWSG